MSGRSKRASRSNNSKTVAGLEKLKKLKSGEGRAIDFDEEEEAVFDYIDEEEYSEIVRKRTDEGWIVDDDKGAGYYEDGREIFDEVDEDSNGGSKYEREYENFGSNRDKKVPLKRKQDQNGKSSKKQIGNMKNYLLSNQKNVQKKSFDQIKVEDDDLLKGILDDINTSSKQKVAPSTPSQQNGNQTNGKNKRKRDDFDENLIASTSNPFSVSTETNFESNNKKVKIESFDDFDEDSLFDNDNLPNDLFDKQQVELDVKESRNSNDYEMNDSLNKSSIDQSFSVENYQFSNDENLISEKDYMMLKAYWIDAYEDPKQPGIVYLFGKVFVEQVKKYFSCCLICKNIEHKIYFCKRTHHRSDESTIVRDEDLEKEVKKVLEENRIRHYRSRLTTKNYAFDKPIKTKGEYLEVLFNPTLINSKIPSNLSGDTFSHVFNYSQSSLERLIIELKLKGPSWLKLKNPISSSPPISWCKFEYVVENPFKQITIDDTDQTEVPLSLMSLSLKTHINPITKQNEIISITCTSKSNYLISKNNDKCSMKSTEDVESYCLITEPFNRSNNSSSDSAQTAIRFPLNFKKNWDKKTVKNSNFQINVISNEKELITLFILKLFKKDPDLLIGHDLNSFDFNILKKRFEHYKILGQHWSKMGKLRRGIGSKANDKDLRNLTIGRLVCDIEIAAKELIRSKSYDLKELAIQILKREQLEYKPENLSNYFKTEKDILRFIEVANEDTRLITGLFVELNILPLYSEITKIAGNLLSRTLLGGRSERNEFLLLHAFHAHNYILPDKTAKDDKRISSKLTEDIENVEEQAASALSANKRNKKAAYTGGLVLEPKVGLHDKYILLMDFNSLYPSIIQEYKICFTTVDRQQFLECLKDNGVESDKQPEIRIENVEKEGHCILPAEIKKLVDGRRKVKSLMVQSDTSADLKQQLDIKQKALKLTANSLYGCLGFSNSRFYAKPLAALITMKGREILSKTKQLVEESALKLEVIYGDTDSLMINTKSNTYDEAESLGYKLKAEVNKNYNLLEIDIDGIFKSILLLKKKKYAALVAKKVNGGQIKFEREIKGLDIIRRDWSLIAKNVGENVLNMILTEENKPSEEIVTEIHNYLTSIAAQVNKKQLATGVYLISKQLTKDIKDYKDIKGQPHVLVATKWNSNPDCARKLKAGDIVQYLICIDKNNTDNFNNLPATQRAFHLEEYKKRDDLEIDTKYYLQSQIHPIVSRLVDPIDGTDANVIAEFLGIESTFCTGVQKGIDLDYELLTRTNETRFDTCKALVFTCPNKECKQTISLRSLIEVDVPSGKFNFNFESCSNCSENFANEKYRNYFANQFTIYLRSLLSEYYQTWYTCEDPICKFRTRRFSSLMTKNGPICPECNTSILYPDITDAQIYLQFNFFSHILEPKRLMPNLPKADDEKLNHFKTKLAELSPLYMSLYEIVQNFKKQQAYDVVDLTYLFNKQVFSFVKLN